MHLKCLNFLIYVLFFIAILIVIALPTTFKSQGWKSDNYMNCNREKLDTAFAILEKLTI